MFGYVTADKPNMLMKDYATYRAYYCGLCKALGRQFTQLTRFGVNYDITFLTILAHNYRKVVPTFHEERCIAHPVGKRFSVVQINEVQTLVADINILLGYYKLEDDVLDGGELKHRAVRAYLKRKYQKAKQRLPALAESIRANYARLRELEAAKTESIDQLADPFATLLRDVGRAAAGQTDDNLDKLCYNLGRWIYFIDAYDDLKQDEKEGKFNPFFPKGGALTEEDEAQIHQTAEFNLKAAIRSIREAYDLMDITITEGAISNVVYCGIRARTDAILEKRGASCKKTLL